MMFSLYLQEKIIWEEIKNMKLKNNLESPNENGDLIITTETTKNVSKNECSDILKLKRKEYNKQYLREYRKTHKEYYKKYFENYINVHKTELKEYNIDYRVKNKKILQEKSEEYYQQNKTRQQLFAKDMYVFCFFIFNTTRQ